MTLIQQQKDMAVEIEKQRMKVEDILRRVKDLEESQKYRYIPYSERTM